MTHQTDKRVVEVLEIASASPQAENNTLYLSRGVTIGFQNVPPMILARIDEKYPDPPIPDSYDENKGRSYPNPNHPDYLKALKDNDAAKGLAMTDVLLGLGTFVTKINEGVQTPDDTEWAEELEYIGIDVPKLKLGRYLAWLKYYVIQSAEELTNIVKKGSRALGITEEEVAAAIASFPSDEERGADPQDSA